MNTGVWEGHADPLTSRAELAEARENEEEHRKWVKVQRDVREEK